MKKFALIIAFFLIPVSLFADDVSTDGKKTGTPIVDGVNPATRATVIPFTNAKGLAVAIVDASGNQITSFGSSSVTQSGVWTVQPGNTPNSVPWLVTTTPGTTGGWSSATESTLSTVIQQVKSSAGTFGGYSFYNANSSANFLMVFDSTSAAAATTTNLKYIMAIPALSSGHIEFVNGLNMASGIYAAVSATQSTITAAATSTTLNGTILYK